MIDWWRVEGFDWDEGNSRKSVDKHDVGQTEPEQVFFNDSPLVVEDARHRVGEPRFHAFGRTDLARPLHVTFTLRRGGTLIRVISARPMHRKERARYEQET